MEGKLLDYNNYFLMQRGNIRKFDTDLIVRSVLTISSIAMVGGLLWLFAVKDWVIVGM